MSKLYIPSPTGEKFFSTYDQFRVNLVLGPIGSGKSALMVMTLALIADRQKPDAQGRRRTRFAVVRNTRQQLKDSCIKTVHDWLPPNGSSIIWRETDMMLVINYRNGDGTSVYSEWMFRSLDDPDDARKLLSVEYTAAWISEFRELPAPLVVDDLRSRMGRFPSMKDGGPTWRGVIGESNMPIEGSEWHQLIEVDRPSWLNPMTQPPAMLRKDPEGYEPNPAAENKQWLAEGYYEELAEGPSENWIKSMLLCEYPPSLDGKAVYLGSFKRDRHVSDIPLQTWQFGDFSPSLLIGVDQGRNPAALICQQQPRGTLYVMRELFGLNMGMDRFGTEVLRPALAERGFVGVPCTVVIDPAGFQKSQVNDLSPAEVLKRMGFHVVPAPTNDILRRIEAVERAMQRNDGLLIDPSCKELIRGLTSEYRFKAKRNGELEDRPEKKHPVSDLQDSLQYVALAAGGVNYGRTMGSVVKRTQVRRSLKAFT